MRFTRSVYCLAIAVAMLSNLATQAHAQFGEIACEEFTAAVAEIEGAFIVSGIEAEETIQFIPPENEDLRAELVEFDTPQLTLPSGTLVLDLSDTPELFRSGVPFSIFNLDQNPVSQLFSSRTFDSEGNVDGVRPLFFVPDPELGTLIGFAFVEQNFNGNEFEGSAPQFFDGDRQLSFPEDGTRFGLDNAFIVEPGMQITHVIFDPASVSEIKAAYIPLPPVVEPVSNQECLASIAAEIGDLADAATDSNDAYALNVACAALSFAAKDKFFEEDGNRLSNRGANVFTGAAYAICYLQHTGVEDTGDIVDRILDKLEQIVDDEIAYAIANGGRPEFIDRAEDLAELAEWIDEDLDNPVAWVNAYFATY